MVTCFRCQQKRYYANDCKNKEFARKISEFFGTLQ